MSLRSRGMRPWFHSRQCLDSYRQLSRAIDAAIADVVTAYEASEGALPIEQRNSLKSDLGWFLELRQMYAPLGEWRDPQAAAPFTDPAVRRVLALDS